MPFAKEPHEGHSNGDNDGLGAKTYVAVGSSVGVVDQPQQDVGGGSVVEQLVEVVAGALDIVAVVDHLAVAVEAFVKGKVLQPRFCRRFYRRHFLRHHVYRLRCWWCNTTWDLFRNGVVLEKKENV